MSLFGFVDDILGTDYSGKKAGKAYKKGAAAQAAANKAALADLDRYNKQATQQLTEYANKGMTAEDNMRQDAISALNQGNKAGMDIYNQQFNQGLGDLKAAGIEADNAYNNMFNQGIDAYNQNSQKGMDAYNQRYQEAVNARSPYDFASQQMIGALPQLQAAMGLPGAGQYDVSVSPMYQWQKGQMDKELTAQLNAMGLNNDNVSAVIRSDNLSRLGAQETQRQMADLQNMVGMGMQHGASLGQLQMQGAGDLANMYGQNAQFLGGANMQGARDMSNMINQNGQLIGGAHLQAANDMGSMYNQAGLNTASMLNQGAINRGNTFNNMGQTLGGWQQTLGANHANALIAGGNSAMNMGIAQAQRPNPINELINTGISAWGMGR